MTRAPIVALVVVTSLALTARADAQERHDPPAVPTPSATPLGKSKDVREPTGDARQRAQALAESGVVAFGEKDFATALTLLLRAEATFHAPTIVLLLARTRAELGERVVAARLYEQVIAEKLGADAPSAWAAAQEIARSELHALREHLATVDIVVPRAAAGAVLTIDREEISGTIAGAHDVNPGKATVISLSAPGYSTAVKTVTVAEGKSERVVLELERGAPFVGGSLARSRLPTYASFTVAGLGFGVGVVSLSFALDRASTLKSRCFEKKCVQVDAPLQTATRAFADAATTGFLVAGAATLAGVLFYRHSDWGDAWKDSARARPLRFTATGETLGLGGSF